MGKFLEVLFVGIVIGAAGAFTLGLMLLYWESKSPIEKDASSEEKAKLNELFSRMMLCACIIGAKIYVLIND